MLEDGTAIWGNGDEQDAYDSDHGTREATQGEAFEPGEDDEEDDGLGYYPDGVKRTLTDEQVAIFRHSEIYAILRQRQVARENLEADEKDEGADAFPESASALMGLLLPTEENVSDQTPYNSAGQVNKRLQNGSHVEEAMPPPALPTSSVKASRVSRSQEMPARRDQKRKRSRREADVDDTDDVSEERKSRAQVRQLDEVAAEEQALDYGNEELDYGDVDPSGPKPADVSNTAPPREGKKIWWPTLGE